MGMMVGTETPLENNKSFQQPHKQTSADCRARFSKQRTMDIRSKKVLSFVLKTRPPTHFKYQLRQCIILAKIDSFNITVFETLKKVRLQYCKLRHFC